MKYPIQKDLSMTRDGSVTKNEPKKDGPAPTPAPKDPKKDGPAPANKADSVPIIAISGGSSTSLVFIDSKTLELVEKDIQAGGTRY
jgi:hypothetical protein